MKQVAPEKRTRLLRLPDVLKQIPVSRSSWYQGVRLGMYPDPVLIGKRTVAWRSDEIDQLASKFQPPPRAVLIYRLR